MRFTKKHVLFFLLLSFLANQLYAEGSERQVIGVVAPLTGTSAFVGQAIRDSIILANEQLPKADRYKILIEDDGFKPANTLSAVKKFINNDGVDFIFVLGTNQGMAVKEVIAKAKIPFLSINVNRSVVHGAEQSFLVAPELEALTLKNIEEAKRRGYKKVAVVSTIQDSCLLQKKIFSDSDAFEITNSFEIIPDDLNVREIATRIKLSNPDAVFLSTFPPQGGVLAKRLREIGYRGDFFGGIQQYRAEEIKNSNGALAEAWFTTGSDEHAMMFIDSYKARYGLDPRELSMFSIYAYDGFRLLNQAIKSGDVLGYLRSVKNFQGASGQLSADGMNGFTFPVAIRKLSR